MEQKLKILYLEDDKYDFETVRIKLKTEDIIDSLEWAKTEIEFKEKLKESSFDVILTDYKLPDYDGVSALKYVKDNYPDSPVIIVSGTVGEEIAIDTIKQGATDYILKQRMKRLIPSIKRAIEEAKERRLRKQAESDLKKSLKEKTVLLRELHHRVKNNMQLISSILGLQADKVEDKHMLSLFKEVEHRIRSIALTHEMFYNVADFSEIDFEYYAHRLISGLLVFFGIAPQKLDYEIEIHDIYLDLDTALTCGLLLNELVANSLKHAFPGDTKGNIQVKLTKSDSQYQLTVSDNGIGLPEGLDWKNTETLGFVLVTSLTRQLGGEVELRSEEGTTFVVRFPV